MCTEYSVRTHTACSACTLLSSPLPTLRTPSVVCTLPYSGPYPALPYGAHCPALPYLLEMDYVLRRYTRYPARGRYRLWMQSDVPSRIEQATSFGDLRVRDPGGRRGAGENCRRLHGKSMGSDGPSIMRFPWAFVDCSGASALKQTTSERRKKKKKEKKD
jgi:hypothetical protein